MENAKNTAAPVGAIGEAKRAIEGGADYYQAREILGGGSEELHHLDAIVRGIATQVLRDDQPRDAYDLRTLYAISDAIHRRLAAIHAAKCEIAYRR